MKNPIADLNKIFDSRKQMLELTDGNLASHLTTLEQAEFIKVHKGFIGRKTSTTYTITPLGKQSFKAHLDALEKMIKKI